MEHKQFKSFIPTVAIVAIVLIINILILSGVAYMHRLKNPASSVRNQSVFGVVEATGEHRHMSLCWAVIVREINGKEHRTYIDGYDICDLKEDDKVDMSTDKPKVIE